MVPAVSESSFALKMVVSGPKFGAKVGEPSTRVSNFVEATSVTADSSNEGVYRATISGDWNAPIIPHGGIVTAIALRAMEAELQHGSISDGAVPTSMSQSPTRIDSTAQKLRSVSVVFAGKVLAGPLEVEVKMLRRGRSASQLAATVRSEGSAAGCTCLAVFGAPRPGFEFTDIAPPVVPGPDKCRSFWDDPPPGVQRRFDATFWRQAEGRAAMGHAPWDDWEPTTSERAFWYRFLETPWRDDGTVDPLALVAFCDTMPGAVGERMGPGIPLWVAPSADLTVHILGEARSEWLLAHNRARYAGEGYASVEMTLWDQSETLVAYGTQMCIFSFPDGPPPESKRRAP